MHRIWTAAIAAIVSGGVILESWGMTDSARAAEDTDPFLWLEEVDGERALSWVRERNGETQSILEGDNRFEPFQQAALDILTAPDRITYGDYRGGHVYDFWQDDVHVRGILRRTSLEAYRTGNPDWETVLDVDAIAEQEDENWVYKGSSCLAPDYTRCLVTLSRGGSDASVIREYDISTQTFVEGGFFVPESKSGADWLDENTVILATDWGEGSMTTSGYPRIVKLWNRGTDMTEARSILEGEPEDVGVSGVVLDRPEGNVTLLIRSVSFFDREYFIYTDEGDLKQVPVPTHMELEGLFGGQLLLVPQKDWTVNGTVYGKGTLIAMDLKAFLETGTRPDVKVVFEPDERTAIQGVTTTKSALILSLLSNVTSRLLRLDYDWDADTWATRDIALPENGSAAVVSAKPFHDVVFVNYESFLVPDTLFELDVESLSLTPRQQLPARFDTDGLVTRQLEAVSADGTRIPYFIIHKEEITLDGTNPTLLYGYGGFRISMDPGYSGTVGRLWLERGGVYVVANIRGGGEFGPAWHEAALKTNRQRAYDDFLAVAEHLISQNITSSRHLGISGGSNGGLLVGAAFTQRPDLFNAVVCAVPLLDMLRFHLLLAGASWIGEYGSPDVPEERAFLETISPYHNLDPDADYPKVLFVTSTRDDRVHPGHARKMAARMLDMGHPVHYYENIEGGHSASANLKQIAYRLALQYVYLSQELMDGE